MQPDQTTANLINILTRRRLTTPAVDGAQQAVVISADGEGVRFYIPTFDTNWAFGPAPYQRLPGEQGVPPAGTKCIAVPVPGNEQMPWFVQCFQGWPQIPATASPVSGVVHARSILPTPYAVTYAPTVSASGTSGPLLLPTPYSSVSAPAVSAPSSARSVLPAPYVTATAPAVSAVAHGRSVVGTPSGGVAVVRTGATDLSVTTTAPNTTSVSFSSGSSTAGNDLLLACGQYSGTGANAQTFTSSGFSSVAVVNNVANVPTIQILRYAGAPSTSSVSVTENSNAGGGGYAGIVLSEASGVNSGASAQVLYSGNSGGAVSTFTPSGVSAPSASGALFFMAASFQVTTGSETSSVTTPSGWTLGGAWSNNTAGNVTYTWWQVGGSGAPNPTLTGFSSNQWVSVIIVAIPHA